MAEKPQSYYGTWINRQRSLLPGLDEELDPLTVKLEHLIIILDTLGLEAFVAPPSRGRSLRPRADEESITPFHSWSLSWALVQSAGLPILSAGW
jgi:hypothetical protein